MANPNLIKQALDSKKQEEHGIPRALVISLAIIGLSVVVYLGFFLVSFLFDGQASAVQEKADSEQAELNGLKDQAVEPSSFVERLNNLAKLADKHVYWTGILSDIASRTDKRLQYTSFNGDIKSNTIKLQGRASDLTALERNILSLEQSKNILHVTTSNITYNIDAKTQIVTVNFDLQLELRPGVLTKLPDTIQLKTQGAK